MKNIHVLPTDKPSRLFKAGIEFIFDISEVKYTERYKELHNYINHNIYITSDEEIKNGDWYLDTFNTQRINANEFSDHKHYGNACKKIILTTDQDLIKDGVQAIDDDFLEWFVKNPSCEFVEVTEYLDSGFSYGYKIIIPKEEPKNICIQTGLPCGMQCLSEEACNSIRLKQETSEEAKCVNGCKHYYGGEIRHHKHCFYYAESFSKMFDDLERQQEQILDFLYSEITERRDYSASKMCEKVIEFIKNISNEKKDN